MTGPIVSVVTPVHNDEPHLDERKRRALSQSSHQGFEYVIGDPHNTDRSEEIAADDAWTDRGVHGVIPPGFAGGRELQLRPARDSQCLAV
jgi:hypothetical protein